MRQAAIDTLNAWLEQTGLTCFVEGELFSTALATDNPYLRSEVCLYVMQYSTLYVYMYINLYAFHVRMHVCVNLYVCMYVSVCMYALMIL